MHHTVFTINDRICSGGTSSVSDLTLHLLSEATESELPQVQPSELWNYSFFVFFYRTLLYVKMVVSKNNKYGAKRCFFKKTLTFNKCEQNLCRIVAVYSFRQGSPQMSGCWQTDLVCSASGCVMMLHSQYSVYCTWLYRLT